MRRQSGVGGCPLNVRNFDFLAQVALALCDKKIEIWI